MTSARFTKLLLLCGLALTLTPWGVAQQAQNQPLQLAIHPSSQKFVFHAELHNTSSQPLLLFVGWDPGGPRWPRPMRVKLLLTHGNDEIHLELKVQPGGYSIMGLEDKGAVYLPAGETFSFPIYLEEYWRDSHAPGRYTVQAIYSGTDHYIRFHKDGRVHRIATVDGPDGKPLRLDNPKMPYWIGTIFSNTLPFAISKKIGR